MSERRERCDRCRFWEPHVTPPRVAACGGEARGHCHRFPPSTIPPGHELYADGGADCVWPETEPDHWCGEFRLEEG